MAEEVLQLSTTFRQVSTTAVASQRGTHHSSLRLAKLRMLLRRVNKYVYWPVKSTYCLICDNMQYIYSKLTALNSSMSACQAHLIIWRHQPLQDVRCCQLLQHWAGQRAAHTWLPDC